VSVPLIAVKQRFSHCLRAVFPMSLLRLLAYSSEAKDGYNNSYYCYAKQGLESDQNSFMSVTSKITNKMHCIFYIYSVLPRHVSA
jgi:hypothetical protein